MAQSAVYDLLVAKPHVPEHVRFTGVEFDIYNQGRAGRSHSWLRLIAAPFLPAGDGARLRDQPVAHAGQVDRLEGLAQRQAIPFDVSM